METKSIMIVGVGGQGTLLASRIIGNALISTGADVKLSEVHGMSQRGGSVVTYVKYGDRVHSPLIDLGEADYILSFEALEAGRFLPYLKKGAAVLDPCCGSGTLLQERARLSEARPSRVIGCDISAKALDAARANSAVANQLPRQIWIHSDLAKLSLKEPVDELFANLPFGNRVGNHESNVALYRKLADKIPEWVKPGGVAVLYTMEGKLLEKELGRVKGLKLLQKTSVEAGGLKPVVFIVRID